MTEAFSVVVEGLREAIDDFSDFDDRATVAARRAVNDTSMWARTQSSKKMREQVNFRARYLTGGPNPRLTLKKASNATLEAVITGRHRPTSLAYFSQTKSPETARRQKGVKVRVSPNKAHTIPNAFLMRLRRGKALTDTQFNLGLAVRLRPGQRIPNKKVMVQIKGNLYLLYGPSVDQVFDDVAQDLSSPISARLEDRFLHLMDL